MMMTNLILGCTIPLKHNLLAISLDVTNLDHLDIRQSITCCMGLCSDSSDKWRSNMGSNRGNKPSQSFAKLEFILNKKNTY